MIGPGTFTIKGSVRPSQAMRERQALELQKFKDIHARFVGPVEESIKQIRSEMAQARQDRIKQIRQELGKARLDEYKEINRQLCGDKSEGTAKLRQEYAERQTALKAELSELESVNHVNQGVNHE